MAHPLSAARSAEILVDGVAFDWQGPVIVNGAGRSGSTLISGILDAHPDINAVGETAFLLVRLWNEYYAQLSYVDEYRNRRLVLDSRPEWKTLGWLQLLANPPGAAFDSEAFLADVQRVERPRVAALLGRFVAESLIPPESRRRHWSFQEIWNGSNAYPYGWDLHHMAFPQAKYLHIVRHPRTWLPSYLQINKLPPTVDKCLHALSDWVRMHDTSLLNEGFPERYLLLRYEDLIAQPRDAIERLLSFVGVDDEPSCHRAAQFEYQARPTRDVDLPPLSAAQLAAIEGYFRLLDRFGYSPDW